MNECEHSGDFVIYGNTEILHTTCAQCGKTNNDLYSRINMMNERLKKLELIVSRGQG